jgi:U5 snRNP spliceosome subunit
MYVDPSGLQVTSPGVPAPGPTPPPGPAPAPSIGPVPEFGPPVNDPVFEPEEAPGIGGAIEACASNPVICGLGMLIYPRAAGGPEDEVHPNVIPFPKAKAPGNTCPGEGSPE